MPKITPLLPPGEPRPGPGPGSNSGPISSVSLPNTARPRQQNPATQLSPDGRPLSKSLSFSTSFPAEPPNFTTTQSPREKENRLSGRQQKTTPQPTEGSASNEEPSAETKEGPLPIIQKQTNHVRFNENSTDNNHHLSSSTNSEGEQDQSGLGRTGAPLPSYAPLNPPRPNAPPSVAFSPVNPALLAALAKPTTRSNGEEVEGENGETVIEGEDTHEVIQDKLFGVMRVPLSPDIKRIQPSKPPEPLNPENESATPHRPTTASSIPSVAVLTNSPRKNNEGEIISMEKGVSTSSTTPQRSRKRDQVLDDFSQSTRSVLSWVEPTSTGGVTEGVVKSSPLDNTLVIEKAFRSDKTEDSGSKGVVSIPVTGGEENVNMLDHPVGSDPNQSASGKQRDIKSRLTAALTLIDDGDEVINKKVVLTKDLVGSDNDDEDNQINENNVSNKGKLGALSTKSSHSVTFQASDVYGTRSMREGQQNVKDWELNPLAKVKTKKEKDITADDEEVDGGLVEDEEQEVGGGIHSSKTIDSKSSGGKSVVFSAGDVYGKDRGDIPDKALSGTNPMGQKARQHNKYLMQISREKKTGVSWQDESANEVDREGKGDEDNYSEFSYGDIGSGKESAISTKSNPMLKLKNKKGMKKGINDDEDEDEVFSDEEEEGDGEGLMSSDDGVVLSERDRSEVARWIIQSDIHYAQDLRVLHSSFRDDEYENFLVFETPPMISQSLLPRPLLENAVG